jgi:hypothetical protein
MSRKKLQLTVVVEKDAFIDVVSMFFLFLWLYKEENVCRNSVTSQGHLTFIVKSNKEKSSKQVFLLTSHTPHPFLPYKQEFSLSVFLPFSSKSIVGVVEKEHAEWHQRSRIGEANLHKEVWCEYMFIFS